MLLQEIKLENIRSYINETILFPEGSILLSGDIGSGKSSLLLAIEFALFGTSRTDLPAEMLLRKGAASGGVELKFILNGEEIIIKRNLKKEKNAIKQISGHLIINNNKKELMPIELKTEMINLLGYPEDFISKNKNYIFRYTVYTPQEEMKHILNENVEIRLDVLRKVFNIDKYKSIRENMQHYLKQMRTKIAVLKTRLEPMEEHQNKLEEISLENKDIEEKLKLLSPELNKKKEGLELKRKLILEMEEEQKKFLELVQNEKTNYLLLNNKKEQLYKLEVKIQRLKEDEEKLFLEDISEDKIKEELMEIEEKKSFLLIKRSRLEERIRQLQNLIIETKQEIVSIEKEIEGITKKEELQKKLKEEVLNKERLNSDKLELEKCMQEVSSLISKQNTLLEQAQEVKLKISSLENCPTCLQIVSLEHKHNISKQEEEKSKFVRGELIKLEFKQKEISVKKNEVTKKIEEILEKENLLGNIEIELKHLNDIKKKLDHKKNSLKSCAQENNQLMQEQGLLGNVEALEEKRIKILEILDKISKKKYLHDSLEKLSLEVKVDSEKIKELEILLQEVKEKLIEKEDRSLQIKKEKEELQESVKVERELEIKQTQLQTSQERLNLVKKELLNKINDLKEKKKELKKIRDLYRWIDSYFMPLTYTIEKQIMVSIHNLFNQLFQEWFSILIEDEEVNSKLDEFFTPIIEQNGYEVSFFNLSGGEKTSAALAYRLALNRVINDVVHQIKTKDLLILDEPTDGFSSEQLDKVREVLEKLQLRQTIIVSHESKIESFVEKVIRIEKEGHVSRKV